MARYVTYALNHEWHSYDMFLSASPGNGAIKKVIIAFVFALLMGALIGVLVAHVSHTEICSAQDRALANVLKTLIKERDSDARDRLLKAIDPGHIEYFQRHFGNATSPQELAEDAKKWWLDFGLDMAEVFTHNQLDEEEYQETEITVQYSNGVVLFRNQNILKVESDATKKLPAGLVEGDLIFANFGQRDDYQYLLDNLTHLRLEGKIAVVKEGKLSVEEKVHQAVAVHIRGLILYPKTHINTSVLSNSNEALPPEDTPATGIDHLGHTLEIPVLTLSHQQADVFTGHMGGYPVPHMWLKDAVSHVGPGFRGTWAGSHVHLNVRDKRKEDSKLYAVVGKIRGSIEPDQYVLLYAHQHVVNVSLPYGSTMLTELARIYGKVMQSGWRPRRTLLFCLFNNGTGEEMESVLGRLGLQQENIVAVVNCNFPQQGYNNTKEQLYASAYPMYRSTLLEASQDMGHPPVTISPCRHQASRSQHIDIRRVAQLWYGDEDQCQGWHSPPVRSGEEKFQTRNNQIFQEIATIYANYSWKFADSMYLPYNVSEWTVDILNAVSVAVNRYKKDMQSTELLDEVEQITYEIHNMSARFASVYEKLDKRNPVVSREVNGRLLFLLSLNVDPGNLTHTNGCSSQNNTTCDWNAVMSESPSLPGLDIIMCNWNKEKTSPKPVARQWRTIRKYLYELRGNLLSVENVLGELLAVERTAVELSHKHTRHGPHK